MSRKIVIGILFLLALASTIAIINPVKLASGAEPAKLSIRLGPGSVPADNNVYECIFVQLQDSSSKPARAIEDTTISLSSSLINIGDVDPVITINKGNTYGVARFDTTFTPGTTSIAATASGYGTVQANLVTVAPVPSKIALYGFPAVVPSDRLPHDALVVQLQDSGGNPAKAPLEGVTVILTSSNSEVASVPASATISGGQTYTLVSITSNATGQAVITAQTSGYTTALATINTQQPSTTPPTSLRVYVGPPKTLADSTAHSLIVVQLLNASNAITQQPQNPIIIQLTSSSESVGSVQSVLEVPIGQTYATAMFYATYKAGTTTITAAATDLTTDTETVTTIGPIPSKLAVYCGPSALPADNQAYNAIQVQLQDANGKPALDPDGDVTVSLFSSEPAVGTVPAALTIPYGNTYATTTFTSVYSTGLTTVTALASGYTQGLGQMRTYIIDPYSLTVTVTSDPSTVVSGKPTNITARVSDPGGSPVSDATVRLTSNNKGAFTTVKSVGSGYYSAVFTTPSVNASTEVTITATVTRTDFVTSIATTQLTVIPPINYGTMQICIKDEDTSQPINEAVVTSLSVPPSMTNLTAITNSTGYVTFVNAAEGNYTFSVYKRDYLAMNETITFKVNSPIKTLYIKSSVIIPEQSADLTYVWIILIAVITISVVVFVLVFKYRRAERLPDIPLPPTLKP